MDGTGLEDADPRDTKIIILSAAAISPRLAERSAAAERGCSPVKLFVQVDTVVISTPQDWRPSPKLTENQGGERTDLASQLLEHTRPHNSAPAFLLAYFPLFPT